MNGQPEQSGEISRRSLLRRGAKVAYVAPVVIAAMKVDSAFASASGGDQKGGGRGGSGRGGGKKR